MISILDPRAWISAVVLCVASVGIGYWRGNLTIYHKPLGTHRRTL